jgi:hypothetical protein
MLILYNYKVKSLYVINIRRKPYIAIGTEPVKFIASTAQESAILLSMSP